MFQRAIVPLLAGILFVASCDIGVPVNPNAIFIPIERAVDTLQQGLQAALADPLGSKPFPVLIGGDSERVFYATNLGDVRLTFRGSTNDFVIPGFVGPTNVYEHTGTKVELRRALAPTGSFASVGGIVADGPHVAYFASLDADFRVTDAVMAEVVGDLGFVLPWVLFERAESERLVPSAGIVLDARMIAFAVESPVDMTSRIHVQNIDSTLGGRGIPAGQTVFGLDLQGDRLMYSGFDGAESSIVLYDLVTDERTVVKRLARGVFSDRRTFLADNTVVWSESAASPELSRIMAYDIPSATTRLWADDVIGDLTGAADDFFITEEYVNNSPEGADRIVLRRYDAEGRAVKLADFRAQGLAGQSRILGDRAAWVNPERRILLQPLAGGDRTRFDPY